MDTKNLYFHLSGNDKLTKLYPRVPEEIITDFEDDETPRISVSPTIDQCLTAIPGGSDIRMYYVYAIDITGLEVYQPNIYEVPDVEYTEELWILEEVEPLLIGEVHITGHEHLANVTLEVPDYLWDRDLHNTEDNWIALYKYSYNFIDYIEEL